MGSGNCTRALSTAPSVSPSPPSYPWSSPPRPLPPTPPLRYYLYGQVMGTGDCILVEMIVRTDSLTASVTMKTPAIELLPQFMELWSTCLMGFYR